MRRSASLVLLLVLSFPLLAQPRFRLRSIEVEGARIPAGIIRAETRLVPGQSYTERDIDQAVYRIRRLPFVLTLQHGLVHNADDDSHTLIFSIVATTRIDSGMIVSGSIGGKNESGGHRDTGTVDAFLRARHFLGDGFLDGAFRAVGNENTAGRDTTIAYTAYGLFGTGVSGTVSLSRKFGPVREPLLPTLTFSIPLTRLQTLAATVGRTANHERLRLATQEVTLGPESTYGQLLWIRDTTDDPFFPNTGTSFAGGPRYSSYRYRIADFTGPGIPESEIDGRGLELRLNAAHYRRIGESHGLWARLDATYLDNELEFPGFTEKTKVLNRDVSIGWGVNHAIANEPPSFWRVEVGVAYHGSELSRQFSPRVSINEPGVMTAMLYRSRWGLGRLAWFYFFG